MKKPATKAERYRMRLVKELGCIISGEAPCEAHHLLSGGVKRGHKFTIGLSKKMHTESLDSYHRNKKAFNAAHGTDDELLAIQNKRIADHLPNIIGCRYTIEDLT